MDDDAISDAGLPWRVFALVDVGASELSISRLLGGGEPLLGGTAFLGAPIIPAPESRRSTWLPAALEAVAAALGERAGASAPVEMNQEVVEYG